VTNTSLPTFGSTGFYPGIFRVTDDYLSSLDSDTREYVVRHTSEDRSKEDIVKCINELHKGRK